VKYLEFLKKISISLDLIISGTSFPSQKSMKDDEELNLIRNYVIKTTNTSLKENSEKFNFRFLDLYEFSSNISEKESSVYRLDSFHLSPKAYLDASCNQLISLP
jgi:hypothetical protein